MGKRKTIIIFSLFILSLMVTPLYTFCDFPARTNKITASYAVKFNGIAKTFKSTIGLDGKIVKNLGGTVMFTGYGSFYLYSKRCSWIDLQLNYPLFRKEKGFNITPVAGVGLAMSPSIDYSLYITAGEIFGFYKRKNYFTFPTLVTFYKDAYVIEPTILYNINFKKPIGISFGINGLILIDKVIPYYSRFQPYIAAIVSYRIK